jgi:hypothetical protein
VGWGGAEWGGVGWGGVGWGGVGVGCVWGLGGGGGVLGGGGLPALEMTALTSMASPTHAAKGPRLMMENAFSGQPDREVRPAVGLNPTTPHRAAGTLTDPPPSTPAAYPLCFIQGTVSESYHYVGLVLQA